MTTDQETSPERGPERGPGRGSGWGSKGLAPALRVARTVGQGLVGLLLGLLAGVATTLAIVVVRAHLELVFLHAFEDLRGWMGAPLVLFPLLGLVVGVRGGGRFRGALVGGVPGLLGGVILGAGMGWALGSHSSMPWAGGVVGAAAGVLVGGAGGALRGGVPDADLPDGGEEPGEGPEDVAGDRKSRTRWGLEAAAALLLVALGVAWLGGGRSAPVPEPGEWAEPDPSAVESVVFFVGDPGVARRETSPTLSRVAREVERWAGALEEDSAVAMVVLGDVVYPYGLHPPDAPAWPEDSARIAAQAATVAGPRAVRRGARGIFLAGNHDWGRRGDREGAVRLVRLDHFLDRWGEATGADVDLYPPAGTGGPSVVDLGSHLRLVLLDTAWWLLEAEGPARQAVVAGVARALEDAGPREVVVAAHHPFVSGGPHGSLLTLGTTLGIRTLLARSGAMLQDLRSPPYRALRRELEAVFARQGAPALFAGGHEHSLQVLKGQGEASPRWHVVSGSASKLTPVGSAAGMVFGRSVPGFARLHVMKDGTLHLSVAAAPDASYLTCPEGEGRVRCMEAGVAAYRTVWSGTL